MSNIFLVDGYINILREVGNWKIIPMKDLYRIKDFNLSYQMFCRKVKRLDEEGYLKTLRGINKKKFLSLSKKGIDFCSAGCFFEFEEDSLNHNIISTKVITELLNCKNFQNGNALCMGDIYEVESDGIVFLKKDQDLHSIAVEVELNQKSSRRLTEKFVKYSNCKFYNYVLYVFNKESVFDSYNKLLKSFDDDVQKKIILCLDKNLSEESFKPMKSHYYYMGKELSFEDLFG